MIAKLTSPHFCSPVQLSDLELAHAESLHDKVEEAESRLLGDMAALKEHHREQIEQLQANHNAEVRRREGRGGRVGDCGQTGGWGA